MENLIEQLRKEWPATFAGTRIDELSGGAIAWGTVQNKRSRKEIPAECFVYSGAKVLVVRDKFLAWWGAQLKVTPSGGVPHKNAPRRNRQATLEAAVA